MYNMQCTLYILCVILPRTQLLEFLETLGQREQHGNFWAGYDKTETGSDSKEHICSLGLG